VSDPTLIPFLTFAVLAIFTPGPSNISASTLAGRVGYRRSMPFLMGMALGLFVILALSGAMTDFLRQNYAAIATGLKWIGAGYIVWLAVSLFRSRKSASKSHASIQFGFLGGFLLVLFNPKGILFALTVFASFPGLLTGSLIKSIASAAFLTSLSFVSTSLWAFTGIALSRLFTNKQFAIAFNVVMALLLLYSAYTIVAY
jgi:cysteine/O-acetylserine efflux protein